jgi:hypothetical protein
MKRFVEGVDRGQSTLFPEYLDDCIDEDNPVRVIDVFVDALATGPSRSDRPRAGECAAWPIGAHHHRHGRALPNCAWLGEGGSVKLCRVS